MENKDKIKQLVFRAFASVGHENKIIQQKLLIEDIMQRNISVSDLRFALSKHAEISEFPPKLCHILERIKKDTTMEDREFLVRFRKQARSSYPFDIIDDDVYTVKYYIGRERCENTEMTHWVYIEKEAMDIYKEIKTKQISLLDNPYSMTVKQLPNSNTRYMFNKKPTESPFVAIKKMVDEYKQSKQPT